MLLNIEQFANQAGVHPSTMRRWLRRGDHLSDLPQALPLRAVGGGLLWRDSDVAKWRSDRIRGALPFDALEQIEPPRRLMVVP